MAILLGCDSVSLEFPTKHIFDSVTLGVGEGDRIGIDGKNGAGKSTQQSVLAGTLAPDDGRVTHRRGTTIGLLGQKDQLADTDTVHHAVVGDTPEYEGASSPRTRQILAGLISDVPWEGTVGELSGGQRRRVDLARLLIGDYDVLMLDEPTNHLDMRTINWLARHLKARWQRGQGAMLVVTHDRWFLDEVCESMWEVHDGVIEPFEGGYSAYMLQRVERARQADVRETKRRNLARKELARLSRGARARSTKQKFHVKAARELIADVPPMRNTLELKQMATSRLGKQVVDLVDVTQIFEKPQGMADIDPDVAALSASASRVDVVNAMYAEPQLHGSVEVAVTDLTDPRLVDAGVPEARQAAAQAEQDRLKAEEEAKKAAEEAASGEEQPKENKVTKIASGFLGVVVLIALAAGDGFYFYRQQMQKKKAEKEALDPDADYTEDKGDFEIPMENEPEETGEEDTEPI